VTNQKYQARCSELLLLLQPLKAYYARPDAARGPAHSDQLLKWMPWDDQAADRLWKLAIKIKLAELTLRAAQAEVWALVTGNDRLLPTSEANEFVEATLDRLCSRKRVTRALGERGRRIVCGLMLRPYRSGGKTGRPSKPFTAAGK
jgi:hypothetical protein